MRINYAEVRLAALLKGVRETCVKDNREDAINRQLHVSYRRPESVNLIVDRHFYRHFQHTKYFPSAARERWKVLRTGIEDVSKINTTKLLASRLEVGALNSLIFP